MCAPTALLVHLMLSLVIAAALCMHSLHCWCTKHCPWSLLQPCMCTHCSPAAQNAVFGHCCSPMWAATALLITESQNHRCLCTKHCPWSLLQPFACTHCIAGAPNIALGHCCSPVHPPAAALVRLTLSLVTAAALCMHSLHCWCI